MLSGGAAVLGRGRVWAEQGGASGQVPVLSNRSRFSLTGAPAPCAVLGAAQLGAARAAQVRALGVPPEPPRVSPGESGGTRECPEHIRGCALPGACPRCKALPVWVLSWGGKGKEKEKERKRDRKDTSVPLPSAGGSLANSALSARREQERLLKFLYEMKPA